MRKVIVFGSLVLVFALATNPLAQDRRLIVVNPSEKELRKEANRLRISPERLKEARAVLHELIELTPEAPATAPVMIGRLLVRYESKQAPELISRLHDRLVTEAERETSPVRLRSLETSASDLTGALRKKHPELADKLESQWPEKTAPGAGPNSPSQSPAAQRAMFEKMQKNPEDLMTQLPVIERAGTNFGVRGALIRQLWSQGKEAAARQLLDETLALSPGSSAMRGMDYGQFIRIALATLPDARDQLFSAVSSWYSGLAQAGGADSEFRLPSGEKLAVSPADHALLSQLGAIRQFHPEFAEQIAALSPTLQPKIKQAGGLSGLFRWDTPARNELRRSLAENSGAQLDAAVANISDPQDLSSALWDLCNGEDPEKAEKVFDLVLQRIQADDNPASAAQQMMSLGQQCIPCVGALPDAWYSHGKELIRQLSESEQQGQPIPPPGSGPTLFQPGLAISLEAFLLSKRARTDFEDVMGEVRAISDKSRRVKILMQVVNDLVAY